MTTAPTLRKILYFPLTKIVIGLLVVMLCMIGTRLACTAVFGHTPAAEVWTGIGVAAVTLLSYILLFRYYEQRAIRELSLQSFGRNFLLGVLTGFILQSLVIATMCLYGSYRILHVNPLISVIPALVMSLAAAVTEEILIRGIVFRLLEEKWGSVIALVASALLFGVLHLGNKNATLWSAFSIAIQAGILLAATYMFARNLWLPIFLHFAWNFTEGGIYGAALSGNTVEKSLLTSRISGNPLITGGAFGPENSVQATVLCLIAGIGFLWLAKKKGQFIRRPRTGR
jgi:putative cofactor-binding repeat protein